MFQRKTSSESSQAKYPSESSQAKDHKRKFPRKSQAAFPNQMILSERSQTEDANRYPDIINGWDTSLLNHTKLRLDVRKNFPDLKTKTITPNVLVFSEIHDSDRSELIPLKATDSMYLLIRQTVITSLPPKLAQANIKMLTQLIDQIHAFRLLAGRDILERPEYAADLLGRVGQVLHTQHKTMHHVLEKHTSSMA